MSRMKTLSLFACVALIHAHPIDNAGQNSKGTNPSTAVSGDLRLEVIPTDSSSYSRVRSGGTLWANCNFNNSGQVWWMKGDRDVTNRTDNYQSSNAKLVITSTKIEDSGDYTCLAKTKDGRSINTTIHAEVYDHHAMPGVKSKIAKVNSSTSLSCPIEEHDIDSSNLEWKSLSAPDQHFDSTTILDGSHSTMILKFPKVGYENNGTYECSVKNKTGTYISQGQRFLIVTGLPEIKLSVKGIGAHSVYLNWTIIEHNIPVTRLTIERRNMKQGNEQDEEWITYAGEIDMKNSSSNLIWEGLDSDVRYRFRLNAYDSSNESLELIYPDPDSTKTLTKDYKYTPSFTVNKKTNKSIIFEFQKVPTEFNDYFDYFTMAVTNHGVNATEPKYLYSNGITLTYELPEPKTVYKVRVAACSSYTQQCGDWSSEQLIRNSSADLHLSRINLVAVIMASVYFSVKHLVA